MISWEVQNEVQNTYKKKRIKFKLKIQTDDGTTLIVHKTEYIIRLHES